MKKKPLTYLLIVGVIAVWAIILRKIVTSVHEEEVPVQRFSQKNNEKSAEKWYMKDYPEDSIAINAINHDPFMGKMEEAPKNIKQISEVSVNINPVIKPPVNWPQIVFQGFSSKRNQKTGNYAILSINNQPYMLAEGESAFGVKLQKNWGDSLALSFDNQHKKIYLHTQ